jgi:hypothetical protein
LIKRLLGPGFDLVVWVEPPLCAIVELHRDHLRQKPAVLGAKFADGAAAGMSPAIGGVDGRDLSRTTSRQAELDP